MWSDFQKRVKKLKNKKCAVLCNRYNYRGVLTHIGDSCLTLSDACAVERSGPSSGKKPVTEDPIGSDVIIPYNTIELVFQPTWVNAPLPSETGYTK